MHAFDIRVHYPLAQGEMFLRTESDWDRSIAPVSQGPERGRRDFRIEAGRAFHYLKPVIQLDGALAWSIGPNYLALASGGNGLDIYPYFFSPPRCHVCDRHELPAGIADQVRAVRVYLPPEYDENELGRYPVLYMHDGQNLFLANEAFLGRHWQIGETLELLSAMSLIRSLIVVGVYPLERDSEYTAPGYERYGRFVVETIKPWVDAHYRTLPGRDTTAVMGASLGGVVSLYMGWQWPEVFGGVACLSSTFGWRDDLAQRIAGEAKRSIRIYLDSGWPTDNFEATRTMAATLRLAGYREGSELEYLAFPNAVHDESHWAVRAHLPIQFLFARPAPPESRLDIAPRDS